jgi:YegS/Rv2252/BmrU family lipid kinase
MARRALLVVNTNSRGGLEACEEASDGLRAIGIEPLHRKCDRKEDLCAFIEEQGADCDIVVVGGGDGTLNTAAPALLKVKRPLGVLPTGTANDLARTLEIPANMADALKIIEAGRTRLVDLGSANGIPFFNVASIGLSTELARELTPELKRRFGRLSYALAAMRVLMRARPFHVDIVSDEHVSRSYSLQVAVGNGKFYGGGNRVSESAEITDGMLDLYSLEFAETWRLLLMFPAFRRGEHVKEVDVRNFRARRFEIKTRRPRPVNADGEIVTSTPVVFSVLPKALEVIVP